MKAHKISEFKLPLARLTGARVPNTAGVYILYRTNMGQASFVGRSDHTLSEALEGHRRQAVYSYFKYMVCTSPEDAFEWECMFWHQAQKSIDNSLLNGGHHPKAPKDTQAECPYPGCGYRPEPQHVPSVEQSEELS